MTEGSSVDDTAPPRIPSDEIRERAYDLWDRHHQPEGYDLQFWLMAELELKAERQKQAGYSPD